MHGATAAGKWPFAKPVLSLPKGLACGKMGTCQRRFYFPRRDEQRGAEDIPEPHYFGMFKDCQNNNFPDYRDFLHVIVYLTFMNYSSNYLPRFPSS